MSSMVDSTLFWQRKWALWRDAKHFPSLVQQCDYELVFVLGRYNFGYSYGNRDKRYTGPVLDLTGATVKLICEKMPEKPSLLDASRGEEWSVTSSIFSVTGVVTDAENGEVTFTLSTSNTDALGDCLAQIEVTDTDDNIIVPGTLRMTFLEKLG